MKPSQARAAVELLADLRRPVFLWGPPGIGKSDIVAQIAKDRGIQLVDKRLSQSDPTELKGVPWPDQKKGVMKFFQDEELPTSGEGILFLDELNNAPAAVQAPAYQLILNRRLGSYVLPDGWAIVAAGNRRQDRSIVHAMPAALANRFVHIDMEPDLDDFLTWAANHGGISAETCGYLRWRPSNLAVTELPADVRAFPSPRTWAFADKIMAAKHVDEATKADLIAGTVGPGCAIEYIGFMREAKNLPPIDAILIAPDKVPVPTEPATLYATVARLDHATTTGNIEVLLKYAKRMPKEREVMYMQAVCRRVPDIMETKVVTDYILANKALLS